MQELSVFFLGGGVNYPFKIKLTMLTQNWIRDRILAVLQSLETKLGTLHLCHDLKAMPNLVTAPPIGQEILKMGGAIFFIER